MLYVLKRTVSRDENCRLHSNVSSCESIRIETLSRRRPNLTAMFVFDVLSGRLDSSALLWNFKISQPVGKLRNVHYLSVERHRTNYGLLEAVSFMSRAFNVLAHLFDSTVTRYTVRATVMAESTLKSHGPRMPVG